MSTDGRKTNTLNATTFYMVNVSFNLQYIIYSPHYFIDESRSVTGRIWHAHGQIKISYNREEKHQLQILTCVKQGL